jgi:hypothetical protein
MTKTGTKNVHKNPKKTYTAPVLISLETTAALNRLREASANGNEQAKSFLAQAEATLSFTDRSGRSDVK